MLVAWVNLQQTGMSHSNFPRAHDYVRLNELTRTRTSLGQVLNYLHTHPSLKLEILVKTNK